MYIVLVGLCNATISLLICLFMILVLMWWTMPIFIQHVILKPEGFHLIHNVLIRHSNDHLGHHIITLSTDNVNLLH